MYNFSCKNKSFTVACCNQYINYIGKWEDKRDEKNNTKAYGAMYGGDYADGLRKGQ